MHGLTLQVRRTVLPRWLNNQPSLTPAVCGEEGRFDTALRAVTHTAGHNSVATFDGSRESVLAPRGNAQPEYPLSWIPASLSNVYTEPPTGLLFVHPIQLTHGYVMRDMDFAIDIVFINSDGKVTELYSDLQPDSSDTYTPGLQNTF